MAILLNLAMIGSKDMKKKFRLKIVSLALCAATCFGLAIIVSTKVDASAGAATFLVK